MWNPNALDVIHYLPAVRLAEGGVVRAVLDLCVLMAERGHRVTLASFDITDAPKDQVKGLFVWKLEGKPLPGGLLPEAALRDIRQALSEASFLHLHGPWDPAHIQLARAARLARVPYGVTAHGMLDEWSMAQKPLKKKMFLALFGRRLLNSAAWAHCTAEGEAAQVRKLVPKAQVVVAPLAFDARPYADLPAKTPSDLPRVLFLSRLHPKKGVEKLIAACGLLRARGTPVSLGIAGLGEDAYVAQLRRQAEHQQVDAEFFGMVAGADKTNLFAQADLFALPTYQENFGLVLVEAMACGLPVITTRGVDIWPELQGAGAEILEVDATSERWANTLADMIVSFGYPEFQERRKRGQAWVLDALSGEQVAARYEQLYGITS